MYIQATLCLLVLLTWYIVGHAWRTLGKTRQCQNDKKLRTTLCTVQRLRRNRTFKPREEVNYMPSATHSYSFMRSQIWSVSGVQTWFNRGQREPEEVKSMYFMKCQFTTKVISWCSLIWAGLCTATTTIITAILIEILYYRRSREEANLVTCINGRWRYTGREEEEERGSQCLIGSPLAV